MHRDVVDLAYFLDWEGVAPEILAGMRDYDTDVDIYGFGMTVLEMVTTSCFHGKPYRECNKDREEITRRKIQGILPEDLHSVDNKSLHDFILRCLVYNSETGCRASIEELLEDPFLTTDENDSDVVSCTPVEGRPNPPHPGAKLNLVDSTHIVASQMTLPSSSPTSYSSSVGMDMNVSDFNRSRGHQLNESVFSTGSSVFNTGNHQPSSSSLSAVSSYVNTNSLHTPTPSGDSYVRGISHYDNPMPLVQHRVEDEHTTKEEDSNTVPLKEIKAHPASYVPDDTVDKPLYTMKGKDILSLAYMSDAVTASSTNTHVSDAASDTTRDLLSPATSVYNEPLSNSINGRNDMSGNIGGEVDGGERLSDTSNVVNCIFEFSLDGKNKIAIEFQFNPFVDTVRDVAKEFVENFSREGIHFEDDVLKSIEMMMEKKVSAALHKANIEASAHNTINAPATNTNVSISSNNIQDGATLKKEVTSHGEGNGLTGGYGPPLSALAVNTTANNRRPSLGVDKPHTPVRSPISASRNTSNNNSNENIIVQPPSDNSTVAHTSTPLPHPAVQHTKGDNTNSRVSGTSSSMNIGSSNNPFDETNSNNKKLTPKSSYASMDPTIARYIIHRVYIHYYAYTNDTILCICYLVCLRRRLTHLV